MIDECELFYKKVVRDVYDLRNYGIEALFLLVHLVELQMGIYFLVLSFVAL